MTGSPPGRPFQARPFQVRIDQRDSADSTEPTLAAEPTESIDPAEKAESADPIEPTEPIDRIEPADPIDKMDPAEPIDKIDPLEPMLRMEPSRFAMESFLPLHSCRTKVPARDDGHPYGCVTVVGQGQAVAP